ncbi:MAG: molecular chaperone SurA [Burkholderiales bacterium]|nr:MAG: molecular chaperone SurA [Burkholderiales bacterium]
MTSFRAFLPLAYSKNSFTTRLLPSLWLGVVIGLVSVSALAQGLRASPSISLGRATQDTSQRSADFIIAIVNSEPITNQEVRNRMLQIEQQLSSRGGTLPSRQELFDQVLERLISERTQLQLAKDNGIRIENQAIDNAVQNIARQNQMSMDQLSQRMRQDGLDIAALRNSLRDELLLQRVREREVEARVRISEPELDAFIREQSDAPGGVIEINLAQILISVPENATEAQVAPLAAKAQRAFERARAGEDFAALAREFSDAPGARNNGGEMGLRNADRYPSLFADTTQNLRTGGVAAPVRSGAGFHVLKVLDKRQQGLANLSVPQTRARHILLRTGPQLSESAARERLADLRKRIAAGLDFATAAKDNSQDGSAREGGDLGWAVPGQFVPEFEEVMNGLAPNQISEPLVSRFGVHLIQVVERRERKMDAREQREAARAALREKKLDDAFIAWAQDLRARAYVELRERPQ